MFGKAQLWSLFRYAGERPLRKTYLTVSIITVSNMFQTLLNNRFIFDLVESGVVLFQIFSVTSYLLIDCIILEGLADELLRFLPCVLLLDLYYLIYQRLCKT